ncbi:MAG TPA: SDR family NAD(P)-dependent oxidoreductase [Devosiaceae bacterium]|jgi:NAD(P)-dependent dehydrogenase (short-subunit alcohol dehydrogenase family)|nr:SDR family NAD(P)-dependent oxidoreductase [Devosiaceae bacterium]
MSVFDRFSLKGRTAIVTGGGDGIGRAASLHLAAAGAFVFVTDKDEGKAGLVAESARRDGGAAQAVALDVTDTGAVERVFAEAAGRGGLDILINNAGVAVRAKAVELSIEDWERVLAVNLTAMFVAARTAARHMIARGQGGVIVNTASIMGLSGGIYPNVAYQTTKGGVVNMTRALALEWVAEGIRVNAVAPTYVRTQFIAGLLANPAILATIEAATPMGRLAEPEEVADAILFLASPAAAMITGTILPVDGGYLAR